VTDEKGRGGKTQTLSLRLDPKTKFMLEFMARIKGQSITSVVERAIRDSADQTGIGPKFNEQGDAIVLLNWSNFWDPSEGICTLNLLCSDYYPTKFEEDELRLFTLVHWPFFYTDSRGHTPKRHYIEILWPSMSVYLSIWRETKSKNHWAAGEKMKQDISAARVAPPDWPEPPPDSDDEIPF
jgi:hypothetical protein